MQADSRPARRAWLLAIALGHLAIFMAWHPVAHHGGLVAERPEGELVLLRLPASTRSRPAELPPPPPRVAPTAPPATAHPAPPPVASAAVPPEAPPAAAETAPQTITLPATASNLGDPFAKPVAPAQTLHDKLRKSAAGIDRQLRKESLNKFATIVDEEKAAGLSISGSHVRPEPLAQNFAGANGIVHKRYMLRGELVCEEVDHIGVGGHDTFRNGSKARLVKCPK